MNKKFLLPILLLGLLTSCNSKPSNQDSASVPESIASLSTSTSLPISETSTSTSTQEVVTISVANSTAGTHRIQGVVVGVSTRAYIVKDDTGIVMVYLNSAPSFEVGDQVEITGTVEQRYANYQFTAEATQIKTSEEKAEISDVSVPLSIEMWEDYDGKIGGFVNAEVYLYEISGGLFFELEGSTLKGQFSYPDSSYGLLVANAGKYATVSGYLVEKSESDGGKNIIFVTAATVSPYIESESVEINKDATTTIEVSLTTALSASVLPKGSNPGIVWSSGNEEIATVSDKGIVKGISVGEVTITAKSVQNEEIIDEIVINVEEAQEKEYAKLVEYDFTAVPTAASAQSIETVLGYFTATANFTGTQAVLAITEASRIYGGNASQGPKVTGIKMGTSTDGGKMVLTLNEDVLVSKVEITAYGWAGTTEKLSVNNSEFVAPGATGSTLEFPITESNTLTIESNKYLVVTAIKLYTTVVK